MSTDPHWKPVEPDIETVLQACPEPIEALVAGDIPAIVLRGAYPAAACRELVERLMARQLLYDPAKPIPEKFIEEAIPEGFYREGLSKEAKEKWLASPAAGKRRVDIGTSLGYRGSDPNDFFAHAAETQRLFADLFEGSENPVDLIYRSLSALSPGKQAVTAHEPDGRTYGPAILRAHYGSYTYKPHFDSVKLREKRESYAVYKFDHQLAGVLVLQNAELDGETAQCTIHRCFWRPELQPHLEAGTFHDFARAHSVASYRVFLNPGDLYFFNTRSIHEVPGLDGQAPRIVLATFIGYSSDEDEIFVWS